MSKSNKTARLALSGVLIALAFILSYVESLLPSFTGIPGVKPGLANIVTMTALYALDWKLAAGIALVRVILSGLTFNGMNAMLYGLGGSVLSLAVMLLLKNCRKRTAAASAEQPASYSEPLSQRQPASFLEPLSQRKPASRSDAQPEPLFSTPAVSIAGGVAHNLGQILVACAMLGKAVTYYLPVLIVSGAVSGLVVGIIAGLLIPKLPHLH